MHSHGVSQLRIIWQVTGSHLQIPLLEAGKPASPSPGNLQVDSWTALKGKSKGKVKDKGLATGSSSISSMDVLDTPEGTRTSMLAGEERMEELVDRSEDLMRDVSVKLNELSAKLSALNGAVLELEGVQATIRKLMK
ncbi:hypothetical protein JB92DRAFT_3131005 [Gautieria morchelliformis]|nr:hypothetical protein JB92DRAFT_3131005 [Gautieria morchelliformis]